MRMLSQQMPAILWTCDRDLQVTYVLGAQLQSLQLSQSEKPDKSLYDFFEAEGPSCLPIAMHLRAMEGEAVRFEYPLAGGFFTAYIEPLRDRDENIIGCIGIAHDITKHKLDEEELQKFRMAIDQSTDMVIITDSNDKIQYVNRAFEKLTGFPKDEVIGKSPELLESGEHATDFYQNIYDTIMSGNVFEGQIIDRKKDGEIFHLESTITPLRDTEGAITYFVQTGKDITERKLAEESLKRAHEVYRRAIENAEGVPYLLRFEDGCYDFLGEGAEQLLGISRDIMTTNKLGELVIEMVVTDSGEWDNVYEYGNAFLDGRIDRYRVDYKIKTPQGREKWLSDCCLPIKDDKTGDVVGSLGILQDITDRKRAEEQRESFAQLAQALSMVTTSNEAAREIVNVADKLIGWDSCFLALYSEEQDSKRIVLAIDTVDEERFEVPSEFFQTSISENMRKTLNEGKQLILRDENTDISSFNPFGDRNRPSASLMFVPIRRGNRAIGVLSIQSYKHNAYNEDSLTTLEALSNHCSSAIERIDVQDALRESEEQYRLLVESVNDGIVIRRGQRIMFCNQRFSEMLGYSKEQLLKTRFSEVLYSGTPAGDEFVELHKQIQSGIFKRYEEIFLKRDGSRMEAEVDDCIIEYSGEPATFAVIRDITERKKLEEELLKAHKLESLGMLAGGIAHDFNNLLTGIIGNLSLAHMIGVGKAHLGLLEKIDEAERAAVKARELTQQLLTFSKGGVPLKKAAKLEGLIRDAVTLALRGGSVEANFTIPTDLWAVEVDESQIYQVINNMVLNAGQAMPQGGTVYITCKNATIKETSPLPLEPGQYVEISIRDEGEGIPQSHINRIFDPYFTTKERGSGLGLASSYSIIRRHGGHITVESSKGEGTVFHVFIPASDMAIVEETAAEKEEHVMGTGRVLIMDDDEIVSTVAEDILGVLGYESECARDGNEAIEKYQSALELGKPFSLVIMDLTIPGGMGGKETIERLRQIDSNVRAIVSSGYSNDPIMSEYWKYGFNGVVPKPYKVHELSQTIKQVMEENPE
jgi:PAS domain S-box-containing protein